MLGLETALSVVRKSMESYKEFGWAQISTVLSVNPAKIAGYKNHGHEVKVGSSTNLTLVNTDSNWKVDKNNLASKSRNTPFDGMSLPATVVATFFNGEIVHGAVN